MPSTLDKALTEVSPVLDGSTVEKARLYIRGRDASPVIYKKAAQIAMKDDSGYDIPITELKPDEEVGNEGNAGGAGLGAVLQGSSPSS